MSKEQNGSVLVHPRASGEENGTTMTCPTKDNVQVMSKQSNWASFPDMFLSLFPTALLLLSGNEDGIPTACEEVNG